MGIAAALKTGKQAVDLGRDVHGLAQSAQDFRHADKGEMGRQAGHEAFNHGAATGKEMGKSWLKTFETIPRFVCRGLQILFALIACGFYGNRVDADRKDDDGFSPEWIFAILVAGLAAITALIFVLLVPLGALPFFGSKLKFVKTHRAFAWDFTLAVAWMVVFGIFAGIFLHREDDEKSYKGANTKAMKVAVWMDLVNVVLWLISGGYGCFKTFIGERADRLTDRVGNKMFTKKNKGVSDKEMELEMGDNRV